MSQVYCEEFILAGRRGSECYWQHPRCAVRQRERQAAHTATSFLQKAGGNNMLISAQSELAFPSSTGSEHCCLRAVACLELWPCLFLQVEPSEVHAGQRDLPRAGGSILVVM